MYKLIAADCSVKNARVAVLGFTFKEDCPDTRNTRVVDIINELREYGIEPLVYDPVADANEAKREYGIEFTDTTSLSELDAVVLAVKHREFEALSAEKLASMYRSSKVLLDVKGMLDKSECIAVGLDYWRL